MDLKEVKAFMKEVGWGDLATTDGKTVGVRPMGGWAWFGDELWCATFEKSEKVRQLEKVPYAEYCFTSKEGRHARIAGKCSISNDKRVKTKLYEAVPALAKYIQDPADPSYLVICMKPDNIRFMNTDDMQYEKAEL